ncbi:MAG TPA: hypothetical protein VFV03_06190, partial [Solirubrobacteraceae bacterium]|nr:hypothetical protein [Solirubrobacteraceae bacterium]
YLLCSDGLTTMLGEDDLLDLLGSHERLRDAGEALIVAANAAGGKDNITVVLFRLEEILAGAEPGYDGHTTIASAAPAGSVAAPGDRFGAPASERAAPGGLSGASAASPTPASGRPVTPRRPRRAEQTPQSSKGARLRGRLRRLRAPVGALVVVGMLAAGAYLALQSVYFIGTNQRGLVTMFRGIPYELPAGIELYTGDYVSGVSASSLPTTRRQALLDHSLRSERDAADLMRQLELGRLSAP